MLLMMPLSCVSEIFKSLWPVWSALAAVLGVAVVVLGRILMLQIDRETAQAEREQLSQALEFLRGNRALCRCRCIPKIQSYVAQGVGVVLSEQQVLVIIQKIRSQRHGQLGASS
jgi:hypothetical protein